MSEYQYYEFQAIDRPLSQEVRRRKADEEKAAELLQREKEAAEVREHRLASLVKREPESWSRVDVLIATCQPARYDEAVNLLCDLRELGLREGRGADVEARLLRLTEEHAKKRAFLDRLKKAGLVKVGS